MNAILTAIAAARQTAAQLRHDNRGATAIEYGLIAAGIAVAITAIVGTVGGDLTTMFTSVSTGLQ